MEAPRFKYVYRTVIHGGTLPWPIRFAWECSYDLSSLFGAVKTPVVYDRTVVVCAGNLRAAYEKLCINFPTSIKGFYVHGIWVEKSLFSVDNVWKT